MAFKDSSQKWNREKQGIIREIAPDFSPNRWTYFRGKGQAFLVLELVIRHGQGLAFYLAVIAIIHKEIWKVPVKSETLRFLNPK